VFKHNMILLCERLPSVLVAAVPVLVPPWLCRMCRTSACMSRRAQQCLTDRLCDVALQDEKAGTGWDTAALSDTAGDFKGSCG